MRRKPTGAEEAEEEAKRVRRRIGALPAALRFAAMVHLLAVAAGFVAGFVNALAGSGSLLTLPALLALGLPAPEANATNRVGILAGAIVAVLTFGREGQYAPRSRPDGTPVRMRPGLWILITLAGALGGALVVVDLDAALLERAIGGLFLGMLVLLVLLPQRWLRSHAAGKTPPPSPPVASLPPAGAAPPADPAPPAVSPAFPWPAAALFLAIGFYGGFLQAGVGVLLLMALVGAARFAWVRANAVKNLIILVFTVPVLALFSARGQVVWSIGLLMAAGQGTGSFLAARFASRHPGAETWIRRLLVAVVAVTAAKLLGLGGLWPGGGG